MRRLRKLVQWSIRKWVNRILGHFLDRWLGSLIRKSVIWRIRKLVEWSIRKCVNRILGHFLDRWLGKVQIADSETRSLVVRSLAYCRLRKFYF